MTIHILINNTFYTLYFLEIYNILFNHLYKFKKSGHKYKLLKAAIICIKILNLPFLIIYNYNLELQNLTNVNFFETN